MSNFEQQIHQRVQAFVAEITELARKQAFDTLSSALAGAGLIGGRGRGRNGAGRRGGRAAAPVAAGAGGRRSPDQIDATCQSLLRQIGASPGQRIEQIGAAIGMRTKDLALPIRKLVAQKQIRTEGQRRATRYYANMTRLPSGLSAGPSCIRPARAPPTLRGSGFGWVGVASAVVLRSVASAFRRKFFQLKPEATSPGSTTLQV